MEAITTWFNSIWQAFVGLDWYIHAIVGAVALLIVWLLLKWVAVKLKGLVITLKIMIVIALIVALVVYFIK